MLSYPEAARADERSVESADSHVDLYDVIKLQKEQIEDYKTKDQIRQEQIDQLNESLNQCREDSNEIIDDAAKKTAWASGGAISGYVVGLVGIVFGATVYAVKR